MVTLKTIIINAPAALRQALDRIIGKVKLIGHLAGHGISTGIAADMLILVGDNPEHIRAEDAFAKLCGTCPIPSSTGKTNRHRLNR